MAELVCPCGVVLRARTGLELLRAVETHLPGHAHEIEGSCGSAARGPSAGRWAARHMEKLTDTERNVAELAARGRTNQEIADRLHVNPKTVEWNLTKIDPKLHVRSRTELALKVRGFPRANRASVDEIEGSAERTEALRVESKERR
jgi:DNA-binding NarL/FixJ family response regulator